MDFTDRPPGPRVSPRRTPENVVRRILAVRQELATHSALGESGARAIRRELVARGDASPAVRTIGRILKRHGAVARTRRERHPPPPRGWYLPDVAARKAEIDGFDVVGRITTLEDGRMEVMTGTSLHGRIVMADVRAAVTARSAVRALIAHWRRVGLPHYAQFDNDTRFTGAMFDPDTVGQVIRLCLSLEVVPVFAAPREHGFQNFVEGLNARWKKVIRVVHRPPSLATTKVHSDRFVAASHSVHARHGAPPRRAFPRGWRLDLQAPLRGRVIFIRRADEDGTVRVLLRRYETARSHAHRLVRCEVDYDRGEIRFIALHRSRPADQQLVHTQPYQPPRRRRFRL